MEEILDKKPNAKEVKKLIKLFIPIFLELLLISLLSSVDTLMLSNYNKLCVKNKAFIKQKNIITV